MPAWQVGQPHTIKLLLPTADLPGQRIYQSRVPPGASAFTASPWAYNGHVFVMSEEGDTFVIEAANEYRLVRTNSLDDFSMATPAIVGDRLLIRTQHRLYSIRNRK